MGGAERWLISMARCCDRRRVEWTGTALALGPLVHPDLCREMSAYMPIYAGPEGGPPQWPDSVHRCSSAREALQTVLRDSDVLITWGVSYLRDLVEGYNGLVVLVSHGDGGGEWARRTIQTSESGATHFASVSQAAVLGFTPESRHRVTILHNGIDVQRCTPTIPRQQMRAMWGFADHHRLIGYVGRYSAEKNPTAAAQAVRHLGGIYHAVYVGSGCLEDYVRQQVQEIAGSRACLLPMVREVGNVLSALDVFVLASPSEGFSLAIAEALYCGTPVVATRVGVVPELESVYGSLVSPVSVNPSPEELAQAVERALTPDFRRDVVPRAREAVARHYTAGVMARRWTDYLCAICGDGDATNGRRCHPHIL